MAATPRTPSAKQRAKRLTPRFYESESRWVVDLPADMNAGKRGRKYFSEQIDAMRWCSNRSLQHKLGLVKERVERSSSSESINGLVEIFLADMKSRGIKDDGIKQAKTCLHRFSETFGTLSPADIGPEEIEVWLDSLNYGTRTVFNHFAQVRQFFRSRGVRRLSSTCPFMEIEPPPKSDKDARKEILTPDQMEELLELEVEPWIRCKIVLGGFAGLRVCELARMTYDCIDEEFGEINVNRQQSKGGAAMRPRSITLQEAVKRHLPKGAGPLVGESKNGDVIAECPSKPG